MASPCVLGLVSYQAFPPQMGGQKSVVTFYAHLSKHTPVTLVVSRDNTVPENNPYSILPFLHNHWWGILNLRYVYRLTRLIREKKISLLLIEHSYFGWLGLLLKRITKKPVIIHSHNIEAHRFRDLQRSWWPLYEWYEKQVHRRADHSFFVTGEDRAWAIKHWQLPEKKCSVITYGTDILQPVLQTERMKYRETLLLQNQLNRDTRLFLFNGTLDYLPNTDALRIIINELLPLLHSIDFSFRIFICGNRLNEQWKEVISQHPDILFKGFVNNIDDYYKGADCFINPITLGSGIKTKLVEALAHNQTAISTRTGAKGISETIVGRKMIVTDDYDWLSFAAQMVKLDMQTANTTPDIFFREFNWDHIVLKALLTLQSYA